VFHAASPRRKTPVALIALVFFLCAIPGISRADDKPYPSHFASLRVSEVNLRSGPGTKYAIQYVYHHQGLPVEIIGQYDVWRKIRDWQGSVGWVQMRMITPARTVIIKGDTRTIYRDPARDSPALAKLEPGVVAKLLECSNAWCKIETEKQGIKGWLLRSEVWGVYADEVVQ
jgi:SH3-like domain-containing protein